MFFGEMFKNILKTLHLNTKIMVKNKKRLCEKILVGCMTIVALAAGVSISATIMSWAETSFSDGDFTYTIKSYPSGQTNGEVSVSANNTSIHGDITIQSSAKYKSNGVNLNFDVTEIEGSAFLSCRGLTTVTIPNTVKKIGTRAFEGCSGLESVIIPNSVTTIGQTAFKNCTALKRVNSSTDGECVFPKVDSMAGWVFESCNSLTTVNIGSNITTIPQGTFQSCSGLTSITIPYNFDKSKFSNSGIEVSGHTYTVSFTEPETTGTFTYLNGDLAYTVLTDPSGSTPGTVSVKAKDTSISGSVTIPNTVTIGPSGNSSTYNVTEIGAYGFKDCSSITSVTILNSVTTIGNNAFRGCSSITTVTIPASVTTIGQLAFLYCNSLASINVNEGNQNYKADEYGVLFTKGAENGETLIQYPRGNTRTSYTIPDDVTTIGDFAFNSCSKLTAVTIPDSVTTIGENAFWYCTGLTSVAIPNSVTTIGESAFNSCSKLTAVTIPNSVTTIGDYTFYDCDRLTTVTIPNSVTTIGESAFSKCISLTSITIPHDFDKSKFSNSGINVNGHTYTVSNTKPTTTGTFSYLDGDLAYAVLTDPSGSTPGTVSVKAKDTSISGSVTIPDTVTIGPANNSSTYTVTEIEDNGFLSCYHMTSVTIPDSVTTIGGSAFNGCSNLADVYVKDGTTISNNAFANTAPARIWKYEVLNDQTGAPEGKTLVKITSVEMAGSVTVDTILCNAMGEGYVIDSLDDTLSGITLTHTYTPTYSWEKVGDNWQCTATRVCANDSNHVETETATVAAGAVTSEVTKAATATEEGETTYTATFENTALAAQTKTVADIGATGLQGNCGANGNNLTWLLTRNNQEQTEDPATYTLTISGSGAMAQRAPWYSKRSAITEVSLPDGLTKIGEAAFQGCSSLTSVTIPASVITIGSYAFYYCSSLTTVTIPDSVETIGDGAFEDCRSLTSVTIPASVTTIGNNAFYNCSSLTAVTIPDSVTTIGDGAFADCSSLADVYVERNTEIRMYAFAITRSARLWKYEVLNDQTGAPAGKTLVKIISVEMADGGAVSGVSSIACDAMGDSYVIDSVTASGITLTHTLTYNEAAEAICTENGHIAGYTCEGCGKHFSDAAGTEEIAENLWVTSPATGHNWGEVSYTWEKVGDNWQCTASRVCTNDSSHVETKTATVTGYSGTYDGAAHGLSVSNNIEGATLEYSTDRGETWSSTAPTYTNVSETTVYVRIQGDENYENYASSTIIIEAKELTIEDVSLSPATFEYDGDVKKPAIKVGNTTLTESTDYTVSYKDIEGTTVGSPTNVGTYTVTVTGKGNYTGTVDDKTFTIDFKVGDVEGDGDVDVQDLNKLYEHVVGISELDDDKQKQRADIVGEDGEINILDLQALYNIIAKG